jgi:hypothetical protein
MFVLAATLLAAPVSTEADLPAGSTAKIQMTDYVNTEQQPLGFTFRGTVEGDVLIGGKIVVPDKSKVLMRLVSDPGPAGGLTLEWWAIKFDGDWSEFRGASDGTGLFTTLKNAEDRRTPKPDSKLLVSRGPQLHIPFNSILQFEIRRPIRLLNVGRFRL